MNLKAIYENGVFRPLSPIILNEHQHVMVVVTPLNTQGETAIDAALPTAIDSAAESAIPLADVRRTLAKIPGVLTVDFHAARAER